MYVFMEPSTTPAGLEIDNENQKMLIEWGDGHLSVYPLYGLRKNCPCVVCRGGHSQMNKFEPEAFFEKDPARMEITSVKQIGNHALQITWHDGHDTGMYRWSTLRELDPENHKELDQ